ncbi:hypothetical protein [Hyalangium gracile]|uniref:hypothetical protein n=1 Tax=Hyalangium gracile TaxID=394092 RepID=UPI001CCA3039|nr:hypothetical protein [Hyalangium gracile]
MLAAALLVAATAGCGPVEDSSEPSSLSTGSQELDSMNGLSANGLSANGLSANGLSANGLATNGLATASFKAWFGADPALGDMVMRYLVRCAVPAGETRSHVDASTGQRYTWSGSLGLAPRWARGAVASRTEQQIISACLMAHVNRYGESVPISVLGHDADGDIIPYSRRELGNYVAREACFFGNLFTQEGLYFGTDQLVGNHSMYLTRACAGLGGGSATACAPMRFVGDCWSSCVRDPRGPFYWSCSHNGVSYPAITTRMRAADYVELFKDND